MRVSVSVLVLVLTAVVGTVAGGRQKRYIFVNPEAPISLGFLLNMPISLALPTLAPVNGRSFQLHNLVGEDELAEDLIWDPAYEQPLSKLLAYFTHLELPNLSCQERLICELVSEPDSFAPIGQIFMKELRSTHGPVEMTSDSLMWRYMTAARQGFTSPIEGCAVAYPKCPLAADRILNMPVLKVWQYISSKLNLQLI
ncbi:uncharacterized protein LOC121874901 [Homarus americanus]|uniref:Uncharacterized protein n=1 Tax=Homarus americanus TaxID=6706 RepID=A0A8J5JTN3_HOMAM|nr:uncharacterized protein LOC121874901 [Homarus americanus]KAG7161605.1 hypothetical protein Hamer_G014170 [Homarus americanus]